MPRGALSCNNNFSVDIHMIHIIYIYASFQITFFLSSEVRFLCWLEGLFKKIGAQLRWLCWQFATYQDPNHHFVGTISPWSIGDFGEVVRQPKFGEFSWVERVGGTMKPAIVSANFTVFLSFTERYIYIYNIQRGDVCHKFTSQDAFLEPITYKQVLSYI